jgi:uncharacterized protein
VNPPGSKPVLAALAAVLVAALAGCDFAENRLVFPGSATQGQSYSVIPADAHHELVTLATRDGTRIQAVFGRAELAGGGAATGTVSRPTVIFFYGNGAFAAGMMGEFRRFQLIGANVIMADFPGYGMSAGRPSEAGFYATADAEYDYVTSLPGIDPERIVACGWSMGGAVAIDLAVRRKVAALVTISAFTSIPALGHSLAPWLPAKLVLRSRFDNLAKISSVKCPILIAHGAIDNIVPPPMADELAAAVRSKVILLKLEGASHNDVFDVGGETLWDALHAAIFQGRP